MAGNLDHYVKRTSTASFRRVQKIKQDKMHQGGLAQATSKARPRPPLDHHNGSRGGGVGKLVLFAMIAGLVIMLVSRK